MIDEPATRVLAVIAAAHVATNRAVPWWVIDALEIAAQDNTLCSATVRQVEAVLREAQTVEVMAA